MSSVQTTTTQEADAELAPVVHDLSVFLLGGQAPSARPAVTEAIDAERLGFRRGWLCERFELKEAGALLSAAASATSRLEVGTAPAIFSARALIVTASLGATMQSLYPGRFIFGAGRGASQQYLARDGLRMAGYSEFVDACDIVKRIWRGETVNYDGPAGSYSGLKISFLPEGPPPPIVFTHMNGPKSSRIAANPVFDGVQFPAFMTPEAVYNSIQWTLQECERIGRDPGTLHFSAEVATAPELDDLETGQLVIARIAECFAIPGCDNSYLKCNGWDPKIADEIRTQPIFLNLGGHTTGTVLNNAEGRAKIFSALGHLVPESYVADSSAVGTAAECVKSLQRFKDAGADEIVCYASTAAQNAPLISAWRDRPEATASPRRDLTVLQTA